MATVRDLIFSIQQFQSIDPLPNNVINQIIGTIATRLAIQASGNLPLTTVGVDGETPEPSQGSSGR